MTASRPAQLFLASLVVWPAIFLAVLLGRPAGVAPVVFHTAFGATVAVEIAALAYAVRLWRGFVPDEPNRRLWALFAGCLALRCLAELRLWSLHLGLVHPTGVAYAVYVVGLRYVFTASDVLFGAGLVVALRTYRATGLPFRLRARDFVLMAAMLALPAAGILVSPKLNAWFLPEAGNQVRTFRFVQICVNTAVAALCIAVRRFAADLGGGVLARMWTYVWIAGVAHAASFLVFAGLSLWWPPGADLFEQYLLWVYGACWLLATLRQRVLA